MRWPISVSIALGLLLSASASSGAASGWQMDEVRALIAEQYEAVDDNMLRFRYQTQATIVRPGRDTVEQLTDFDPSREPGEKERLIAVDGGEPDADSLREFSRRPQPDEREEQRIRLTIRYDTLELLEEQDDRLVFRFQPGLRVNGREDSDGDRFTGRLVFNVDQQHIERVEMNATEEFSKLLFRIRQFDVLEEFYWAEGRLLRRTYYHDMDLRNALINASNEITMRFDYPDIQLAQYP